MPKHVHVCTNPTHDTVVCGVMTLCVACYEREAAMRSLDDILCLLLLHGIEQNYLHYLRQDGGPLNAGVLMDRMAKATYPPGTSEQKIQFLQQVCLDKANIIDRHHWTSPGG